ncbi:Jerky -like [Araneus ventricosus]|uniref:Jerky-like n=1 Tax=Araneus ventricosus TaxID=182803 RepID=A0A4Y2U8S4_ARAVE|nr:Jerky -like [Araneus ventricosus]
MESINLPQEVLLLLDNCPGHPSIEELCADDGEHFRNVSTPNTTDLIQPMDQNVIQNIKLGYRKLLLKNILNDPVQNENLEKTPKNVNVKNFVFSFTNCWASVSTLLINKSCKNLISDFVDSEVEENVQTEEIQLESLINQLQSTKPMSNTEALQWAAEADDSLARNEILTDDEIIGSSRR